MVEHNVSAVTIWAAADSSSGYMFCWQDGEDFNNFTMCMTQYGVNLAPKDYYIQRLRGHKKPPADVVEAARQYCVEKAGIAAAQMQPMLEGV